MAERLSVRLERIFDILILGVIAVTQIGCQGTRLSPYVGVGIGPAEISIKMDSRGHLVVTGEWKEEVEVPLGPISLKAGVEASRRLAQTQPYSLFIVFRDKQGVVYYRRYKIGRPFKVTFDNERIRSIEGKNDTVIVVIERTAVVDQDHSGSPETQAPQNELDNPREGQAPRKVPTSSLPNLLPNPGFEQGWKGWAVSQGSATYEVQRLVVHSELQALKGKEVNQGSLGRAFRDVTGLVHSGQMCEIGGWIRTEDVRGHVADWLTIISKVRQGVFPNLPQMRYPHFDPHRRKEDTYGKHSRSVQ